MSSTTEEVRLMTPAEVASLFRVDPKTVTRWAKAGRLTSIRTLGGHRRYREDEVRALIRGSREGTCPDCQYQYGTTGHRKKCGDGA